MAHVGCESCGAESYLKKGVCPAGYEDKDKYTNPSYDPIKYENDNKYDPVKYEHDKYKPDKKKKKKKKGHYRG